jgi:hypothetical protein
MPSRAAALIWTLSHRARTWGDQFAFHSVDDSRVQVFAVGPRAVQPVFDQFGGKRAKINGLVAPDPGPFLAPHGLGQQVQREFIAGGEDDGPLDIVL